MGGNGVVVYSCVSVSSFFLSICALWCFIQVIVHVVHVLTVLHAVSYGRFSVCVCVCVCVFLQVDKNLRLLTATFFFLKSDTVETFWDVEEDKKFEVCSACDQGMDNRVGPPKNLNNFGQERGMGTGLVLFYISR